MIIPEARAPTLWRPPETTIADDHAGLDPALEDLVKEDQWIADFIKRLNYAINEIVRQKS